MMDIQFGADYYPEHWPEDRWETDAKLMREMGLGVVRMAEFAWTRIEPKEGEFRFEWLERAVNLLGKYGVKTILGTPTPTPPAWIIEKHPEILPINSKGVKAAFGGRHHNCQSNRTYRSHAVRMLEAFTSRFRDNPHVVGWQTDNELGNSHDDLCHCPSCRTAFQDWLQSKYGTVEELNRRWGTVFWSQEYDSFLQIPTPAWNVTAHSPSLLLDWKRFHSDLICDFQQFQIDIIRKNCPGHMVTHNFMGFFDIIDYFKLAESLDFISHDQYPTGFFDNPQPGKTPAVLASALDLMRGLKNKTFWIMEQQSGPTGWTVLGRTPEPGQLSLWAAQSVARGADCVVFFRWRTCTVGTEQYWHGILPHSGNPGRRYGELKETISRLAPVMKEFKGALSGAEGAILYDYDQNWSLEIQPHHPDLAYIRHVQVYYDAFHKRNIPLDFISREGDFSSYKLIIAPLMYLMTAELEKRFETFVEGGGRLVLTMRTGVKNRDNVCMAERELPGESGDLLGIEIRDYDCLRDICRTVQMGAGKNLSAEKWCDIISLKGAESLAEISDGWYPGNPVVTVNSRDRGKAYYVGTEPNKELALSLADTLIEDADLLPPAPDAEGLEVVRRRTDSRDYFFVLNHSGEEKEFTSPAGWSAVSAGNGAIPPYGYGIYQTDR
ncbi:MAG: beta-galactosidase [Spirochaetales bacterium]|nr:beta-galactosidase [Spirochaetales bacterium]